MGNKALTQSSETERLNESCDFVAKRKRHYSESNLHQAALQVKPRNNPELIDYHLSSPDGKHWQRNPGRLMVMIGATKPEDTDEIIEDGLKQFIEFAHSINDKQLQEKLSDCKHKLYAVRYHLTTVRQEINQRVEEFKASYSGNSGVALEIENPRLVYETEALLFQVKSSLDILTQALGCIIPPIRKFDSFMSKKIGGVKHAGGDVINTLSKNNFETMASLFEQHRTEWIQELVEMRNIITHNSRLRDFHCFIEEPYTGGEKITIHFPTMPSGKRVDVYCEETYDNLMSLYTSVITLIPRITPE